MIILRQRNYSFGRFFEGFGDGNFSPSKTGSDINPALLEQAKKYKRLPDRILNQPIESAKLKSKQIPLSMKLIRDKRKKH
jgi:hypothetical protein